MRFALGYLCILPLAPRRIRAENRRDEAAFAAAGVCGGSLYFLLENVALEYAPASNVSLLVCTAPVWTALAAGRADRGERMTRRQAAGAALAAAGMALRKLLADGFAARLPLQLAALGIGGCATTGVFLLAAWPLGLGEEAAALWAAHRPGRPKK